MYGEPCSKVLRRREKARLTGLCSMVSGGRSIDVLMAEQDSNIHPMLRAGL